MFQLLATGHCPRLYFFKKKTLFPSFSLYLVDLLTSDEYSEGITKNIQTYGKQAPHVCKVGVCMVSQL